MLSKLEEERKLCSLSDFEMEFETTMINEWQIAYVDYYTLKDYLKLLKNCYACYHHKLFMNHKNYVEIMPIEPEVRIELEKAVQTIDRLLQEGKEKAKRFCKWKLMQTLYYWEQVIDVTVSDELLETVTHQTYDKKRYLKQLIQLVYASTMCLKEFIQLNAKIQVHCNQVKTDYWVPLQKDNYIYPDSAHSSSISQSNKSQESVLINQSDSTQSKKILLKLQEKDQVLAYINAIQREANSLFYSPIYYSESSEDNINDFARIIPNKEMSGQNYFLFGLYIGLGAVILIMLIMLMVLFFIELQSNIDNIDSMDYIFPMFRGVGLLILYLWGMAWNVYGFIKFKINFKLVLRYGAHYSSPFEIMRRAGFFTLVFCFMLFLYLIGYEAEKNLKKDYPIQYTPFVVWICYFAYIFFPSQQMFNSKGRMYFYSLLKSILLSPFVKMGFVLSFATDQSVSFITSIKDFAYSICFYGSNFTVAEVSNCLKSSSLNGIIVGYIAALIPLVLRLIQCYRTAIQNSGQFFGDLQMWNFFKYVSSILTSTLSFLSSLYPGLFVPFLVSSIISTSYSYYWDLKIDWGLLEKDSKHFLLRNKLCYKHLLIYYVAIAINLIFRCSWTLTISPAIVLLIPKSTFLPFLTGFIEILRRCMWNFFRIEKEHVTNCNQFIIAKENPDKLVGKIKAQERIREFMAVDPDPMIQYIKVADSKYIEQLKSAVCKDYMKIQKLDLVKEQQEFKNYCQMLQETKMNKEAQQAEGIKVLSEIKRDYFDI